MRVLILGASGMLGHKLWQVCRERFETWATVRGASGKYVAYNLFDPERLLDGVDASDFSTVVRAFDRVQPHVVVNATGIVKQSPSAKDPIASIEINALFPHRLARLCRAAGAKLVHISTDCVFSGRKGMYKENDTPDAVDLYGRSKLLGEVQDPNCLTLRTSLIGREVATAHGLVEWFLSNSGGSVRGYTNAIFSGLPTLVLSEVIAQIVDRHAHLSGLYHVSSDPISKYQLLCLVRDAFHVPILIEPFPEPSIDRSLDSSQFRTMTGYVPTPWPDMVMAMAADGTPYDSWRHLRGS